MAAIQTAEIDREMRLVARYTASAAERDLGLSEDIEIIDVTVCGVRIPLSAELYDALRAELLDIEFA